MSSGVSTSKRLVNIVVTFHCKGIVDEDVRQCLGCKLIGRICHIDGMTEATEDAHGGAVWD